LGRSGGARNDPATHGLDLDRIARRRHPLHRHVDLHRHVGKLGQQRAEPLAAERIDVAFERARKIHRRNIFEVLAATERAEHEFDSGPPVAEIFRQNLRAGHICFSARSILDRAVRLHDSGEIILHLAFARVALDHPQLLPRRRRVDLKAGA
jgi:hypothetical protein